MRDGWLRSVRAAWPMRGITKKSAAVMARVATEAPRLSPRRSRPRPAAGASGRAVARPDSTATGESISIHAPAPRETRKTKKEPTPQGEGAAGDNQEEAR